MLLRDVARQLGIALRAAQLSADVQSARERLVLAREEERRRIRNDLHDGLAPTLSSLQLRLGAVRRLIRQDPAQAETLAGELGDDLRIATGTIRQLVYELRPPMLDELQLVGALRSMRFTGSDVHFEVQAPEPMPALPAAVEAAVYRIASEAMHNVVKHAGAANCLVRIEASNGRLALTVSDDGTGTPGELGAGIGIRSMRDRAEELGGTLSVERGAEGGTRVTALIPINL
jgi:signal transduction histidine kinase